MKLISRLIPLNPAISFYLSCLIFGPLMGSLITEPAAMTVTAILIYEKFFTRKLSTQFMYATLGLLFVNISIGGTLTPYAAPPVLMVAKSWNWDLGFMFANFGWKATLIILCSTLAVTFRFRSELQQLEWNDSETAAKQENIPAWVSLLHLSILAIIILTSHHLVVFFAAFLFFLGLVTVTQEYQQDLKLKEGLLVGFFLGGLVVLGGPQRWWLEPVLTNLNALSLYLGSISLTAITDNAALTYLGSQVPDLSTAARYALVAGAVTGGGLTVIANAPNLAGYGILNSAFGSEGISPLYLFYGALFPTAVAALFFWVL
jgi:hypothetical protein